MAERTKSKSAPVIKCVRTCCAKTTRTPKASGWVHIEEATDFLHHLEGGWICPPCFEGFQKLMAENGIEPETGYFH